VGRGGGPRGGWRGGAGPGPDPAGEGPGDVHGAERQRSRGPGDTLEVRDGVHFAGGDGGQTTSRGQVVLGEALSRLGAARRGAAEAERAPGSGGRRLGDGEVGAHPVERGEHLALGGLDPGGVRRDGDDEAHPECEADGHEGGGARAAPEFASEIPEVQRVLLWSRLLSGPQPGPEYRRASWETPGNDLVKR